MGKVDIRHLSINYGNQTVIDDLSISINDKEIVSLLGPSGAGKTTILKAIAGLLPQAAGEICFDGKRVDHLAAEKRDAVLIFQKPLLFPFLNVRENIGFGLKMAKLSKQLIIQKTDKIIEITGLGELQYRKINQLSGGQQQRVALARGLVLEPSVLLLDEPLSSLDPELRQQMRELILRVQSKTGTTMLFVTHDQGEAFALSNRVCLLLDGKLQQTGSPKELFYSPASPDVARFFGCTNFYTGSVKDGQFRNSFLKFKVHQNNCSRVTATIRPEDIRISTEQVPHAIEGQIVSQQFEGTTTNLEISIAQERVHVVSLRSDFDTGQTIWLSFPGEYLKIFCTST